MKITYIYILLLFLVGCSDDFLDRKSPSTISEDSFWETEAEAQLGVNGIFEALQARVLYSGNLGSTTGIPGHDNLTDNSFNEWKWEGAGDYVEGNSDPSLPLFEVFWDANYRGIVRSNQAIENISKMKESQITTEKKNNLLGQAYFLRALFYFNIVLYYEDAPLITKVQSLEDAYVSKNPEEEIFDQIVKDLDLATNLLPNKQPENLYGYATKGSALAYLTRTYLYNQNWNKAADAAESVMDLGIYSLHPNYKELFSQTGETSPEIIFSVRFQEGSHDNGELFSATYLEDPKIDEQPLPNMVSEYYCKDGLPINESPLYDPNNEKEDRDPRLEASVYVEGDIYLSEPERIFQGNTFTGYGLKKYVRSAPSEEGIPPYGQGSQDFYVVRYADLLLMRAEALVESGNSGTEVYELINRIRERVDMPKVEEVEGAALSTQDLLDVIRHERRVEFAFEGLRFYDLKRYDVVEQAYIRIINDNIQAYNPRYRDKQSETFAIPQAEIDANRNLEQNSAW